MEKDRQVQMALDAIQKDAHISEVFKATIMQGELGVVIDKVNQRLQALMGYVREDEEAEGLIMDIANLLRAHYRAEAVVSESGARFIAKKRFVMAGARCVAVAPSHTMAKRIARALNGHVINERGV